MPRQYIVVTAQEIESLVREWLNSMGIYASPRQALEIVDGSITVEVTQEQEPSLEEVLKKAVLGVSKTLPVNTPHHMKTEDYYHLAEKIIQLLDTNTTERARQ